MVKTHLDTNNSSKGSSKVFIEDAKLTRSVIAKRKINIHSSQKLLAYEESYSNEIKQQVSKNAQNNETNESFKISEFRLR